MAKAKQSAAEAYRALRRQNSQAGESATEMVTLPSGIEFELQKIDVAAYVRAGRLPESLLKRGMHGWEKLAALAEADPGALSQKDAQDAVSGLVFMREVVQEACINPQLVPNGEGDDELDPKYLSEEDFYFIFAWATNQISTKGGPAESLAKFRK